MERLDDRNPRIRYTGEWFQAGGPREFNESTTGTQSGQAVLELSFEGTQVIMYGTVTTRELSVQDPITVFSVDGKYPDVFAPNITNGATFNVTMYTSPALAYGSHMLTVRNVVDNGRIYIDYIDYRTTDMPVSSSESGSSATPTSNSTLTNSQPEAKRDVLSSGAVAGISIAGTLILMGCLFVVVRWITRRKMIPKMSDSNIDEFAPVLQNETTGVPTTSQWSSSTLSPYQLGGPSTMISSGSTSSHRDTDTMSEIPPPSYRA